MKFTEKQKISVMRIMIDIINADGKQTSEEKNALDKIKENFNMSDEDMKEVERKNSLLALKDIKEFTSEQKKYLGRMMTKMTIIDTKIHVSELAIYEVVAEFCKIPPFTENFPESEDSDTTFENPYNKLKFPTSH